ncbi:MAG: peroxiredoxin [Gammaproteobacteria bacterium]|nr:peroxiredoxin [Gammaproteobacteria bacterium]
MALKIGDRLPELTLPGSGGRQVRFADYRGKKLVVYFYPKDDTPGCTVEGQDFNRLYAEFAATDTEVVGISRDSIKSHDNFSAKFGFTFTLLSDADELACKAFDVIREKTLYGRKYLGVDRSTFLFDDDGVLKREWRGVKVPGHAEEVLAAAQAL